MNTDRLAAKMKSAAKKSRRTAIGGAYLGFAALLTLACAEPSGTGSPQQQPLETPAPPVVNSPPLTVLPGDYVLKLVDKQPLPIKSPYGVGEWDYDSDAGTWQLIEATLAFNADGTYTNTVRHRAKSGATVNHTLGGFYTRPSPSTYRLTDLGPGVGLVTLDGDRLIWDWGNGTIMTLQQ